MTVIIVNKTGASIMQMSADFEKYAREVLHLANPFKAHWAAQKDCYINNSDGSISIDMDKANEIDDLTKISRKEWIEARDKYIAERILRELGYEVLTTTNYSKYLPDAIPCEGATGQCSFDCPDFFECGLKKSTHYI